MRETILSVAALLGIVAGYRFAHNAAHATNPFTKSTRSPTASLRVARHAAQALFLEAGVSTPTPVPRPRWLPVVGDRFTVVTYTPCWDTAAYLSNARAFALSERFDPRNPWPTMHDYNGTDDDVDKDMAAPYSLAGPSGPTYDGIVVKRVAHGFYVAFPTNYYDGNLDHDYHASYCFLPDDLPIYAPGWAPRDK